VLMVVVVGVVVIIVMYNSLYVYKLVNIQLSFLIFIVYTFFTVFHFIACYPYVVIFVSAAIKSSLVA